MAGNQENGGNGNVELQFREKVYEELWTIPLWASMLQSRDLLAAQTFEFETGGASYQSKTKWSLGMRLSNFCYIYWKLLDVGQRFPDGKVQATLSCTLLKNDSTEGAAGEEEDDDDDEWTDTQTGTLSLGEALAMSVYLSPNLHYYRNAITEDGKVTFKLKLVIMEPELEADLRVKMFEQNSEALVLSNLAGLIGDEATADLKIITSDEKELFAHKAILKAQCPVFESMFRSDMSENNAGIVKVDDLTFKTMGIFLHLFYCGELLPSWKDQDTVVEFTHAVDKYQLTNVLKLLDEVLGSRDEEDATRVDMQLLDLAQKLNLKNAEKELVERIKRTMAKVHSGTELFALCGMGN